MTLDDSAEIPILGKDGPGSAASDSSARRFRWRLLLAALGVATMFGAGSFFRTGKGNRIEPVLPPADGFPAARMTTGALDLASRSATVKASRSTGICPVDAFHIDLADVKCSGMEKTEATNLMKCREVCCADDECTVWAYMVASGECLVGAVTNLGTCAAHPGIMSMGRRPLRERDSLGKLMECPENAFPINLTGKKCMGLEKMKDVKSEGECRDMCCNKRECTIWQWKRSCWTGTLAKLDLCVPRMHWKGQAAGVMLDHGGATWGREAGSPRLTNLTNPGLEIIHKPAAQASRAATATKPAPAPAAKPPSAPAPAEKPHLHGPFEVKVKDKQPVIAIPGHKVADTVGSSSYLTWNGARLPVSAGSTWDDLFGVMKVSEDAFANALEIIVSGNAAAAKDVAARATDAQDLKKAVLAQLSQVGDKGEFDKQFSALKAQYNFDEKDFPALAQGTAWQSRQSVLNALGSMIDDMSKLSAQNVGTHFVNDATRVLEIMQKQGSRYVVYNKISSPSYYFKTTIEENTYASQEFREVYQSRMFDSVSSNADAEQFAASFGFGGFASFAIENAKASAFQFGRNNAANNLGRHYYTSSCASLTRINQCMTFDVTEIDLSWEVINAARDFGKVPEDQPCCGHGSKWEAAKKFLGKYPARYYTGQFAVGGYIESNTCVTTKESYNVHQLTNIALSSSRKSLQFSENFKVGALGFGASQNLATGTESEMQKANLENEQGQTQQQEISTRKFIAAHGPNTFDPQIAAEALATSPETWVVFPSISGQTSTYQTLWQLAWNRGAWKWNDWYLEKGLEYLEKAHKWVYVPPPPPPVAVPTTHAPSPPPTHDIEGHQYGKCEVWEWDNVWNMVEFFYDENGRPDCLGQPLREWKVVRTGCDKYHYRMRWACNWGAFSNQYDVMQFKTGCHELEWHTHLRSLDRFGSINCGPLYGDWNRFPNVDRVMTSFKWQEWDGCKEGSQKVVYWCAKIKATNDIRYGESNCVWGAERYIYRMEWHWTWCDWGYALWGFEWNTSECEGDGVKVKWSCVRSRWDY